MTKKLAVFIFLVVGAFFQPDIAIARTQFGLQLGTITGLTARSGSFQGTLTLGDNMLGHLYYTKRSGRYIYYGIGTILNFGELLDSDSKGGVLIAKGKKKKDKDKDKNDNGSGFNLGGLFGSGDDDGDSAFDNLILRIPVGVQTYFDPVVVFLELGFYVVGASGSDSALGVRFYF